jgi:ubiquinone/menaquinone biosynthesis C-methylase UbiE
MRYRYLEIGPGKHRLPSFETLDVRQGPNVDYVSDARKLPFADGVFDLIYASHVIEHFPWYEVTDVLSEWRRALADTGCLEIWTVNATFVCKALLRYEETGVWEQPDKWTRHGVDSDPYLWCNGRIFAYGRDGNDVNWHRALFTPRSLEQHLLKAGFSRVTPLKKPRGKDHGAVNLGLRAWNGAQ